MSNLEWAKREVELACQKENPNRKDGEFDYGCACYESALKAFESLCEDGHSGLSISQTAAILNRLISGRTLTPIEGTDDEWGPASHYDPGVTSYQCNRMGSLFKEVYSDGTVKYHDNDYVGGKIYNHYPDPMSPPYKYNALRRITMNASNTDEQISQKSHIDLCRECMRRFSMG